MRIELADILDIGTSDEVHLTEHLIRFRFASPRRMSVYHRALDGGLGAETILPGAPNREGIRTNLERLRANLEERLAAHRGSQALAHAGVDDLRDLLRLHVEHFARPDLLYTNGQTLVTLVRRTGLVELALHPDLEEVLRFPSDYGPWPFLAIGELGHFTGVAAAETFIRRRLGRLEVEALSLVRGDEERTLLLQRAGSRRAPGGQKIEVFLARFGGHELRLRLDRAAEEPFAFLNRLELEGFRARCCATCRSFRFTGMTRDMSGGSKGYCSARLDEHRKAEAIDTAGASAMTRVSVWDACGEHFPAGHRLPPPA